MCKVADHYCDPGEAVYDQKILFLSFNVTSLLKAGSSNALGARLGNSKWGYLDIYSNRTKHADQSGDSSRAFRMALVVTMTDGKTHTIKTTTAGWKVILGTDGLCETPGVLRCSRLYATPC